MIVQARRWLPFLSVVTVALAGCQVREPQPDPVPAPPEGVDPTAEPGQRQALLDYARSLDFDSVIHGASDRQPLTFIAPPNRIRLGPVASILPERRSHNNTEGALREGRILARIRSEAPYPPLGMPSGVSYLWIDQLDTLSVRECRDRATTFIGSWLDSLQSLAGQRNLMPAVVDSMQTFRQQRQNEMGGDVLPCNGVARAVIIPDDTETPAEVRQVFFRRNDQAQAGFALARWIFSDDYGWVSCAQFGCCVIVGGPFI